MKPCDCRNGDECFGDYPPKGIKCRDLEPPDPGIDPDGPPEGDVDYGEDCNVEDSYGR